MMFDDRLHRVIGLYEEGEFALAANLALHFLSESPDHGRLLEVYGAACCNLKDFETALEALEAASALVSLHPLAQFALATCYVLKGQCDLAASMYEHLATVVTNTSLLSAIATRLGALDCFESALGVCRKIKDLDPSHHQAFFGMAYYLHQLGNPPEALIPLLRRATDLAPEVLRYRIHLAFVLADAGRPDQACALLRAVPLEAVGCPCHLRRMQDLFERAGDTERSLRCKVRLACLLP